MIGIYKIENMINHKIYIGQSVDILGRWKGHKNKFNNKNSHSYEYPLYKDIRKYDLENFDFKVIEECDVDLLDERERYWIKYYNSFFNGYNQTFGGEGGCKLDKSVLIKILDLLKNTDLIQKEIALQCNVSEEMVQGINTGRYWNDGSDEYPIRKPREATKSYCVDCGCEIFRGSKRCKHCENKRRTKENNKQMKVSKEELNELIHKYPFTKIGKMFGVTDNSIRKWCKKYGLPYKYRDLHPQKEINKEKRIPYDNYIVEMSNEKLSIKFEDINKAIDYLINNKYTKENASRSGIKYNITKAYKNNKTYLKFNWNLIKRD